MLGGDDDNGADFLKESNKKKDVTNSKPTGAKKGGAMFECDDDDVNEDFFPDFGVDDLDDLEMTQPKPKKARPTMSNTGSFSGMTGLVGKPAATDAAHEDSSPPSRVATPSAMDDVTGPHATAAAAMEPAAIEEKAAAAALNGHDLVRDDAGTADVAAVEPAAEVQQQQGDELLPTAAVAAAIERMAAPVQDISLGANDGAPTCSSALQPSCHSDMPVAEEVTAKPISAAAADIPPGVASAAGACNLQDTDVATGTDLVLLLRSEAQLPAALDNYEAQAPAAQQLVMPVQLPTADSASISSQVPAAAMAAAAAPSKFDSVIGNLQDHNLVLASSHESPAVVESDAAKAAASNAAEAAEATTIAAPTAPNCKDAATCVVVLSPVRAAAAADAPASLAASATGTCGIVRSTVASVACGAAAAVAPEAVPLATGHASALQLTTVAAALQPATVLTNPAGTAAIRADAAIHPPPVSTKGSQQQVPQAADITPMQSPPAHESTAAGATTALATAINAKPVPTLAAPVPVHLAAAAATVPDSMILQQPAPAYLGTTVEPAADAATAVTQQTALTTVGNSAMQAMVVKEPSAAATAAATSTADSAAAAVNRSASPFHFSAAAGGTFGSPIITAASPVPLPPAAANAAAAAAVVVPAHAASTAPPPPPAAAKAVELKQSGSTPAPAACAAPFAKQTPAAAPPSAAAAAGVTNPCMPRHPFSMHKQPVKPLIGAAPLPAVAAAAATTAPATSGGSRAVPSLLSGLRAQQQQQHGIIANPLRNPLGTGLLRPSTAAATVESGGGAATAAAPAGASSAVQQTGIASHARPTLPQLQFHPGIAAAAAGAAGMPLESFRRPVGIPPPLPAAVAGVALGFEASDSTAADGFAQVTAAAPAAAAASSPAEVNAACASSTGIGNTSSLAANTATTAAASAPSPSPATAAAAVVGLRPAAAASGLQEQLLEMNPAAAAPGNDRASGIQGLSKPHQGPPSAAAAGAAMSAGIIAPTGLSPNMSADCGGGDGALPPPLSKTLQDPTRRLEELHLSARQLSSHLLDLRVQLAMLSNRQVRLDNPMLAARIKSLHAAVCGDCDEPADTAAAAGDQCAVAQAAMEVLP